MKSRLGAPVLFALALFLLSATALAQMGRLDPVGQPAPAAAAPAQALADDQPAPAGDAIFPMATDPRCFRNCLDQCAPPCNQLPPDQQQQCGQDCAEGCRCLCGICN